MFACVQKGVDALRSAEESNQAAPPSQPQVLVDFVGTCCLMSRVGMLGADVIVWPCLHVFRNEWTPCAALSLEHCAALLQRLHQQVVHMHGDNE